MFKNEREKKRSLNTVLVVVVLFPVVVVTFFSNSGSTKKRIYLCVRGGVFERERERDAREKRARIARDDARVFVRDEPLSSSSHNRETQ